MTPSARPLRRQIHRTFLAALLATLLPAGVFLGVSEGYEQSRRVATELAADVAALSLEGRQTLLAADAVTAARRLQQFALRPDVAAVALYDRHGQRFAAWTAPTQGEVPATARPRAPTWSSWHVESIEPVLAGVEPVGFALVRREHRLLSGLLRTAGELALLLLAGLAAAGWAARRLDRGIGRPARELAAGARQLLRDEPFRRPQEAPSCDEIEAVAAALESLGAEMQQRGERLAAGERARERFLATLAHELRNPLAPIRTGLRILERDREHGPASQRAREMMDRQLAHLVRLIDDLVDVSRMTTGRLALLRRPARLKQVVRSAIESVRPAVEARQQVVSVTWPPHDPELDVDADRLVQAFGNLLANASKHAPAGGRLEVRVELEADAAILQFSDGGTGIAREELPHLFELFSQVHGDGHGPHAGLGIGLYLVRTVIGMHGGTVAASSGGLGQGATFTVRLPTPAAAPGLAAEVLPGPQERTIARKVLVVDDNRDAASALATALEQQGHAVLVANDGAQSLELARQFQPDVVVLDIGMPVMDGYEAARRLAAGRTEGQPVLVAATGWGTDADRARAREAGFDHHLTKPVDLVQLERIIDAAPGRRPAAVGDACVA